MARHLLGFLSSSTHIHRGAIVIFFSFSLSLCPFGLGGVPGTKSPQGRTKAITIDRFLCCAEWTCQVFLLFSSSPLLPSSSWFCLLLFLRPIMLVLRVHFMYDAEEIVFDVRSHKLFNTGRVRHLRWCSPLRSTSPVCLYRVHLSIDVAASAFVILPL